MRPQPPSPLSAVELAADFAGSMFRWSAAGFAVTDRAGFDRRMEVCQACPHWDGAARLGLGRCRACGCTRFKPWLATEQCPDGRWPAAP